MIILFQFCYSVIAYFNHNGLLYLRCLYFGSGAVVWYKLDVLGIGAVTM
jgi:hypothetical protein